MSHQTEKTPKIQPSVNLEIAIVRWSRVPLDAINNLRHTPGRYVVFSRDAEGGLRFVFRTDFTMTSWRMGQELRPARGAEYVYQS